MGKTPFPHQSTGIEYGTTRPGGGFFYLGMRTGKTFTTVETARKVNKFPALVVAPATVLASWENELLEEGYTEDDIVIIDDRHTGNSKKLTNLLTLSTPKWFLLNFEKIELTDALNIRRRFHFHRPAFIGRPGPFPGLGLPDWGMVVVDESYRIANHENSVTQYLLRYEKPEDQLRFCLSGSPASESPRNLASQFVFVDGHFFNCKTVEEYLAKYYWWDTVLYKWIMRDKGHEIAVRDYVQRNAFCLTMEDLGLGAKKLYSSRIVEPNAAQLELQKWLSLATGYQYPDDDEFKVMEPVVRVTFEQRIAAGIHPLTGEMISDRKIDYVLDMLVDHPDQRFLILSRFTAPINRMAEKLLEAGFKIGVIDGSVGKRKREEIRKAFQAGELDHVVAQVTTVKMGLDFSSLDAVVYISNSFSQDDRAQSEDRGQHTLRKTPYGILDICARGFNCLRLTNILTKKKANAIFYIKQLNQDILERVRK